jgi:hypothetical protein
VDVQQIGSVIESAFFWRASPACTLNVEKPTSFV